MSPRNWLSSVVLKKALAAGRVGGFVAWTCSQKQDRQARQNRLRSQNASATSSSKGSRQTTASLSIGATGTLVAAVGSNLSI